MKKVTLILYPLCLVIMLSCQNRSDNQQQAEIELLKQQLAQQAASQQNTQQQTSPPPVNPQNQQVQVSKSNAEESSSFSEEALDSEEYQYEAFNSLNLRVVSCKMKPIAGVKDVFIEISNLGKYTIQSAQIQCDYLKFPSNKICHTEVRTVGLMLPGNRLRIEFPESNIGYNVVPRLIYVRCEEVNLYGQPHD